MVLSDFEKECLRYEFPVSYPPLGATYTASRCLLKPGDRLCKDTPLLDLSVSEKEKHNNVTSVVHYDMTISYPAVLPEGSIFEACHFNENQEKSANYARITFFHPDKFFYLIQEWILSIKESPYEIYMSPCIPEKKLKNALKTYAPEVYLGDVLYLYDMTVFGSADEGFIVTESAFHCNFKGGKITIPFSGLTDISLDGNQTLHIDCEKEKFFIINGSYINIKSLFEFFTGMQKLHQLRKSRSANEDIVSSEKK